MWTNRLTAEQADRVRALAAHAEAADGIDPLNEEARFALRGDGGVHVLLTSVPGTVSGYLQWQPAYGTAQLVVDPAHRRRGLGTSLLAALDDRPFTESGAKARVNGIWAFGDLPAAIGFAKANGLTPTRALLIMSRGLAGSVPPVIPPGLTLRRYTDEDAAELLAVNSAAFAHHPEQGALDAAGLAARMAEPWFDPSGLILGFDADGLVGFHWTKRVDAETGEVYVIGVAPRAQGKGYGRVLLEAGLAYLHRTVTERVLLYVDSSEAVAVRMYESAGFGVARRDVLYAPDDQEQP